MPGERAVFLDRDGTPGRDGGFCHPDAFALVECAPPAIKMLGDAGFRVIVVTNRTRVGAGEIALAQAEACFERLRTTLAEHGARLDGWYVCPHLPEHGCGCRKPSACLLRRAAADVGLDLGRSYMVGDVGSSDLLAGAAAGGRTVLVLTGWGGGSLGGVRHLWSQIEPDYVAQDLVDAAAFVVRGGQPDRPGAAPWRRSGDA